MAREPCYNNIPFAEGCASDELQVEAFGDEKFLYGDPSLDIRRNQTDFDSNLAED